MTVVSDFSLHLSVLMMSAEASDAGAHTFSPTWTFEVHEGPLQRYIPLGAQEVARALEAAPDGDR